MAHSWKNWSGSVKAAPSEILYPASEDEVQALVQRAGRENKRIRVVGAGHSFTPLCATDLILVSLDRLEGISHIAPDRSTVTVFAGTRLKALGEALHAEGLAMENLGDIDVQSIAGAISTGTHGTGTKFGTLSTQVVGLNLVTADGAVRHLSPTQTPEEFKAAQVSFGALGIITRITLRVLPAYKLEFVIGKASFSEVVEKVDEYLENRNFEYYYFPHSNYVQTRTTNVSEEPAKDRNFSNWLNDVVLENGAFWLANQIARVFRAHKKMARLSTAAISKFRAVNWSHRVFATVRMVKFQEMEYNVPASHYQEVMREVRKTIEKENIRVMFPIEVRWVKGDDIWLSPASGRDSVYIAIHMLKGMPYEAYFRRMEQIFRSYGGRPHWGKMHFLTAEELRRSYPRFDDFRRLRAQWDPKGIFLNPYLSELLAADQSISLLTEVQ